jgi:ABC-type transport system involved in multi-copper enzyme maturation permease subunit
MIKAIQLEFLKLRHLRAMWVLLGLYAVGLCATAISGRWLSLWLDRQGAQFRGLTPSLLPIYDFADIWQNLAYVASYIKIFPALLLIISMANEYSYKTQRQNIIDGLSRAGFMLSKLSFALFLAVLSALLLLVLGLVLGMAYSPVTDARSIAEHLYFVPVHALQLLLFFLFAMLLVLLLRRSGITIMFLLAYAVLIEPVLVLICSFQAPEVGQFLPLNAINHLVPVPFGKFLLMETQTTVDVRSLCIALGWGAVWVVLIARLVQRRDF